VHLYKVVARSTLLYGSEAWETTTRDMTCLEVAEMCFLRSVKGYTRLDKIRSEVIRKLETCGIQDVGSKHKTGSTILKEWTAPDFRIAVNYKPRGRRDHGCSRKQWECVSAGIGHST
jgi:hypothetical protein